MLEPELHKYRDFRQLPYLAIQRACKSIPAEKRHSAANRVLIPRKFYPDAETIVDAISSTIRDHDRDTGPFFVWAHLFDAHIPYCSGSGNRWARDTKRWLAQAGHDRTISPYISFGSRPEVEKDWVNWRALYDASICFLDNAIGRLYESLPSLKSENTLLVVTADHGEELGDHGDSSHKFRLYEHNARVPMIFYHPDLRNHASPRFATVLDIAPTVQSFSNTKSHPLWEGVSLLTPSAQERNSVILESMFGSPCDPLARPIYFAIRRNNLKFMLNEYVESIDLLSKPGAALFDIAQDPDEMVDLSLHYPSEVSHFTRLAAGRAAEIRAQHRHQSEALLADSVAPQSSDRRDESLDYAAF